VSWRRTIRTARREACRATCRLALPAAGLLVAALPLPAQHAVPPTMARLEAEFMQAVAEHGLDGWVAAFSDSAVVFRVDQPILRGRAVIRSGMANIFSDTTVRVVWQPTGGAIAASNDLGYTFGYYRWTHRDAAGSVALLDEGKYFTVWRREADGVWRVTFDTGSSGPVPAGVFP
jgi:ketosteroid isomerase-like protein